MKNVSIILPTYNPKYWIYTAIDSVKRCIDIDYELIIVNDGSTDPTSLKILEDLRARGYKVLDKENGGIGSARNAGIAAAEGEYILPLDDDNFIDRAYISKAITIMSADPSISVVYSDCRLFGNRNFVHKISDIDFENIWQANCIDTCAVFRKKLWVDVGGYDTTMLGFEDWEFWIHALSKGYKFYHIPEVLFYYRVRDNSVLSKCSLPEQTEELVRYVISKHHTYYSKLLNMPKISVIVPVCNPDPGMLRGMLESLRQQAYKNWELCLADGNSNGTIRAMLESYSCRDSRIKVKFLNKNQGIALNSNEAISISTGEYLAMMDHDDFLPPLALFELVKEINRFPDADTFYSDEMVFVEGVPYHYTKEDFSLFKLRETGYFNHLTVYKKSLLDQVGFFKSGYDGAQDYELALRASEKALKIIHIPKVLYHWRVSKGSFSHTKRGKRRCIKSAVKALKDHFGRLGLKASVTPIGDTFKYKCIVDKTLIRPYHRDRLSYGTPIGDALLMAPVARGLNADIDCTGFIRDLLILAGGPVKQEFTYKTILDINPLASVDQKVFKHPLSKVIWGSPEFYKKYGHTHITKVWSSILGVKPGSPPRITKYEVLPEYKDKILLVLGTRQVSRMWKEWGIFTEYLYQKQIPYAFLPEASSAQELVNIIGSAKHMITTMTGPMHIRAALDKPQICLCVGDDPYLFAPLSDKATVLWNGCSECFYKPPRLQGIVEKSGNYKKYPVTKCDVKRCHFLVQNVIAELFDFSVDHKLLAWLQFIKPKNGSVVCRTSDGKQVVNELRAGDVTITASGNDILFTTEDNRQAVFTMKEKGE